MKTTDLIPILLYQLKEGDKYGLELIEACSNCSNGKIKVKQPTLYSVLKKLEKSKFISSYWQDSDIGGKRHYFKISANGLAQLETYPPIEDLVKLALSDEEEISLSTTTLIEPEQPKKEASVFDKLFISTEIVDKKSETDKLDSAKEESSFILSDKQVENDEKIEDSEAKFSAPVEEIGTQDIKPKVDIPSPDFNVFEALSFADEETEEFKLDNPFYKESKEKSLEEKTNLEINEENSKLFNKEVKTSDFIENEKIISFTKKKIEPKQIESKEISNLFDKEIKPSSPTPTRYDNSEQIAFQDYIDIKNDKNVKQCLKASNLRLTKVITSTVISFLILLASLIGSIKMGFSAIYTAFLIVSTLYITYYTCNFIGKFRHQRYVLGENFKYNFKKKIITRLIIFAILCVLVLVYNLIEKLDMFKVSNFASFYAPLLISSLMFIDYLIAVIFYKKI